MWFYPICFKLIVSSNIIDIVSKQVVSVRRRNKYLFAEFLALVSFYHEYIDGGVSGHTPIWHTSRRPIVLKFNRLTSDISADQIWPILDRFENILELPNFVTMYLTRMWLKCDKSQACF